MNTMKSHIKQQITMCVENVSKKSKEQKQHFTNSIKKLEKNIVSITEGVDSVFQEVKKLGDKNFVEHCH